ncbi:MAG: hypothetical protein ACRDRP_19750 [Pseudonocardiaceae bacterium]
MTTPTMYSPPRDGRHMLTQAQRLAQDAATAAEVRTWQTHPDVVALRVERIRSQVDRLMWAGIVLGLCFTMTNVQQFAAAGASVGSPAWWSAWLLDPMVSLVLLAVLRAEQVTTRYQVTTGPWPRVAKWSLLTSTYLMNTWASWAAARCKRRSRGPVRRKLLVDYLAEARAAWTPGLVVSPTWVRQVTDCSRGLSSKVAAALKAELTTDHDTTTTRTEPEGRAA